LTVCIPLMSGRSLQPMLGTGATDLVDMRSAPPGQSVQPGHADSALGAMLYLAKIRSLLYATSGMVAQGRR